MDAIKEKLHPIRIELEGKRVLLIDDSIVRGNTSKSIVKLVRDVGAKEVHYAVYSPALRYPCFFGIDIQHADEFLANRCDKNKIANEIGADSLHYLSIEGLIKGVGFGRINFCTACFSGKYPVKVTDKDMRKIQKDRSCTYI